MSKVAPWTVVWSYNQIFSAWWVTTILYNYGAMLCELCYYLPNYLSVLHFRSFIPGISSLGDNISSGSCITTEASPLPILDTPTDQGYILHMGADRTLCAYYVKVLEDIDFRLTKNGNIYYNLKVVLQSFSLVKGKSNLILYLSKRKKRT